MLMMNLFTYTDKRCTKRSKSLLNDNSKCHKKTCRLKTILLLAAALFFTVPTAALAVSGEEVIDTAMDYLGYPYGYQCAGPDAFDCGGFVWYAFNQAGVDFELRIDSSELAADNTAIYDIDELLPGDILFFGYSADSIYHWGIYAGEGEVIHSYNEGTGVVLTPIESVLPSFCYACRLDALAPASANIPYFAYQQATAPDEIPAEILQAIDCQLLPLTFGVDYNQGFSEQEVTELLSNLVANIFTAQNSEQLLKSGLLVNDFQLKAKYDPMVLAERIIAIAENPDEEARRSEYISLIIYSLPLINIPSVDTSDTAKSATVSVETTSIATATGDKPGDE